MAETCRMLDEHDCQAFAAEMRELNRAETLAMRLRADAFDITKDPVIEDDEVGARVILTVEAATKTLALIDERKNELFSQRCWNCCRQGCGTRAMLNFDNPPSPLPR